MTRSKMNDTKSLRKLLDGLEDRDLLPHEKTAYNFLLGPAYEGLPMEESHEGRQLHLLCVEVILGCKTRLKVT